MHFDFIVNIHGGSGTALKTWKTVKKYLIDNNLDYKYYLSEHAGHGIELAKKIYDSTAAGEYINLVIVGGDGTINEVLNGIPDFKRIRLGLIP
ncbi:MAG: acylglycerol kinase family protein, partial [Treponema sp.]|nr:acylglycerol kinase family protein [Treponema sp.]